MSQYQRNTECPDHQPRNADGPCASASLPGQKKSAIHCSDRWLQAALTQRELKVMTWSAWKIQRPVKHKAAYREEGLFRLSPVPGSLPLGCAQTWGPMILCS